MARCREICKDLEANKYVEKGKFSQVKGFWFLEGIRLSIAVYRFSGVVGCFNTS